MGKRDADDGRQEFGRKPHCQRKRKEQRIYQRLGEEKVDRENYDHHHEHDLCQEITEPMYATFELGLRRAKAQSLSNLTEYRGLTRLHNEHPGGSGTCTRSHKTAVCTLCQT